MRRGWAAGVLGGFMAVTSWLAACASDDEPAPMTTLLDASSTTPSERALGDASNTVGADAQIVEAGMDGAPKDAGPNDADLEAGDADADSALPILKRFSGGIDFNGPFAGAKVELLAPTQESLVTDETGNFFFYAPVGSVAVVKATPPEDAGALPMIRGIVVEDAARVRIFYLQAKSDLDGLAALGITLDPTKAIVEVDFRNAEIGGYGVTMKNGAGATLTPGFGIASGASGFESSLVTLRGGDGTTMFYGNVEPGEVSFTPVVPADAGNPVIPCDAPKLPLEPGVVTWFDFECGLANCH